MPVECTDEGVRDYAWNYFRHGIDVCFDGSTHVVKSLVLHSNSVCSHDFNAYQKCHFQLVFPAPATAVASTSGAASSTSSAAAASSPASASPQFVVSALGVDSRWPDIAAALGASSRPLVNACGGAATSTPIPLDDNTVRLDGTVLHAYPHLVFEVLRNSHLAAVQLLA